LNARRPTVPEAVQHLVGSETDKYRRQCIAYWRQHYGDDYAEEVRREAHKRVGKRRDPAVAPKSAVS
jgi:hypothetical protein